VAGGAVFVSVTIHTTGLAPSVQTEVWLAQDDVPSSDAISGTVPAVAAGGRVTVDVRVPAGTADYGVKVDPNNQLEEVSESNNAAVQGVVVDEAELSVYLPIILR